MLKILDKYKHVSNVKLKELMKLNQEYYHLFGTNEVVKQKRVKEEWVCLNCQQARVNFRLPSAFSTLVFSPVP